MLLGASLGLEYEYKVQGSSLSVPGAGSYKVRQRDDAKKKEYHDAIDACKPVFLHLEFRTHEQAWEAMEILQREASRGAPLRPTWIKSQWYRAVAARARKISPSPVNKRKIF